MATTESSKIEPEERSLLEACLCFKIDLVDKGTVAINGSYVTSVNIQGERVAACTLSLI